MIETSTTHYNERRRHSRLGYVPPQQWRLQARPNNSLTCPETAGASQNEATAIAAYSEVPLLIIDNLGMRKLPASAAKDLLEIVMRRYERGSTMVNFELPTTGTVSTDVASVIRQLRLFQFNLSTLRASLDDRHE